MLGPADLASPSFLSQFVVELGGSARVEILLLSELLRHRALKNPVTDRVFAISYPRQSVDRDGDSPRLGAF